MKTNTTKPIVAIMGHIDHGKSTLLDYIRKTNVVGGEAGGITQHLSAYEISIPYQKEERQITFIDTPGHAAFSGMRERGVIAADIAVLIVSAEDGVKAQTIEAIKTIKNAKINFIVAINKIDKPESNIEKTKQMLAEQEILVEGYGGIIPWVAISAKTGAGITELLDTLILVSDMEEIKTDLSGKVEGVVIESKLDSKRGITATIVIKSGVLKSGQFVVAGKALATTRIMENFQGKILKEVTPGSPVQLVGFDQSPEVGTPIVVFEKKKDAEKYISSLSFDSVKNAENIDSSVKVIPLIIKTDVFGTAEAIENEIKKINVEGLYIKIIGKGIGNINESDIRLAQSDKESIIIGFNTDLDNRARDLNEQVGVNVQTFNIIYKLTEWLEIELEKLRPRVEIKEISGVAKVLKCFSKTKDRQVLGCRIDSGNIIQGIKFSVVRRDFTIGTGTVIEIQQAKQ